MYLNLLTGWIYRVSDDAVFATKPEWLIADPDCWSVSGLSIRAFNHWRGVYLVPLV